MATTNRESSATPLRRPDHKAKPHPRPKAWNRKVVRQQCEAAIAAALGVDGGVE